MSTLAEFFKCSLQEQQSIKALDVISISVETLVYLHTYLIVQMSKL
jgi:hypothetical protein